MARREATCPLCGAKLTPAQVLDACEEVADASRSVLSCHCPHCQGHLEVMPAAGRVDIGYLRNGRFDVVLTLACDGLTVLRDTSTGSLRIRMPGRDWKFDE